MSDETTWGKRVKRQVIGRKQDFFAACAPGVEPLLAREIAAPPVAGEAVRAVAGGVVFSGRLHQVYLANLHLRTANRVLMRLSEIRAASFSRLETQVAKWPWELHLFADTPVQVHVRTHHCRLYHSEAVAQRFLSGIRIRLDHFGTPAPEPIRQPQQVFVRGIDDLFTLSLDSSGALLYKRGIKRLGAPAPIRETLAAAILQIAGYTAEKPLIDPMCGTGTFCLEAAMMARNIPPGWFRDFAFTGWPAFRPSRWEFLRREAETGIQSVSSPKILASDKDPDAVARLQDTLKQVDPDGLVQVAHHDFFDLCPARVLSVPGLVVLNPPYGHRMALPMAPGRFFAAIGDKLNADFLNWNVAIIAPSREIAESIPLDLDARPIYHGGMNLILLTGKVAN